MKQSEKLDFGWGFLSVVLDTGGIEIADDLRWCNALVLTYNVSSDT